MSVIVKQHVSNNNLCDAPHLRHNVKYTFLSLLFGEFQVHWWAVCLSNHLNTQYSLALKSNYNTSYGNISSKFRKL